MPPRKKPAPKAKVRVQREGVMRRIRGRAHYEQPSTISGIVLVAVPATLQLMASLGAEFDPGFESALVQFAMVAVGIFEYSRQET